MHNCALGGFLPDSFAYRNDSFLNYSHFGLYLDFATLNEIKGVYVGCANVIDNFIRQESLSIQTAAHVLN